VFLGPSYTTWSPVSSFLCWATPVMVLLWTSSPDHHWMRSSLTFCPVIKVLVPPPTHTQNTLAALTCHGSGPCADCLTPDCSCSCYSLTRTILGFIDSFTVLDFVSLWHIPEKNNLKGGIIYFGTWFQIFQSMVTWPHARGQNITVTGTGDGGTFFTSWWPGSR
jgi:hypothetical protein